MPGINHACLAEVLYILRNYLPAFYKDWTCSDSLCNIPVFSSIFICDGAWIWIWETEFVSVQISSVWINILRLKCAIFCESKCTDSWMIFIVLVNFIFIFDSSFFSNKRSRNIQSHVEISSINNSVDNIVLYILSKYTCCSILLRGFGEISESISICIFHYKLKIRIIHVESSKSASQFCMEWGISCIKSKYLNWLR